MTKVLAAVMAGGGAAVDLREFDEPVLEPDSALLQVELSEVCGTDVALRQGLLGGVPYPIIPGHVSVGRLERIRGRLVDVEGTALAEGDRVTFLDVHRTCNACWYCLVAKATTRCPKRKVYGITYGVADGLTGGWAQKIYLKPDTRCIRLDGVDPERFIAGGCALPTALHAVELAEIALGDTVLVLGSGPVGLSAVILAHMRGAFRVLSIGAPRARLDNALRVGAAAVLNFEEHSQEQQRQWVLDLTSGRGADVTMEATNSAEAVVQAMRLTRDAGRVVIVGQYTDHGPVSFNPHQDLNRKHLDVRGLWGSDFSHFYRAAQLLADPQRSLPWSQIETTRYGLSDADRAVDDVRDGRVVKAIIDPTTIAAPRA